MAMTFALTKGKRNKFFVSDRCHPQTIGVVQTRADTIGVEVVVGDADAMKLDESFSGALFQYPDTYGNGSSESRMSVSTSGLPVLVLVLPTSKPTPR